MNFRPFGIAAGMLLLLVATNVTAESLGAPQMKRVPMTVIDPASEARIDAWVAKELPSLIEIYKDLHAHPELSLQEIRTATVVANRLRDSGFTVEMDVGGHGVLGILRNGAGPTIMLRGDMDGLPITEATGLSYASSVQMKTSDDVIVGTMHACGHDVHTTNLIGTAALLSSLTDVWRGTVVVVAQPAEEVGRGALMMIDDGLFDRIPQPDYGLALHVAGDLPAGAIGAVSGWAAANVDQVKITIHGRGGHGARPHQTVDPIVTSAHLITALQTIVSRRVDPSQSAVVTVGSIHGGTKSNVIPDAVKLELTVRSYSDDVRAQLLRSIENMARETCALFECPRPPDVWVKPEYTPAMFNDPGLVEHGLGVFRKLLGDQNVHSVAATMTGEDFGRYTRRAGFPTFLYRLGSVGPSLWQASEAGGVPLPSLHSSEYAPDPERTLRTALRSMSRLALSLLAQP